MKIWKDLLKIVVGLAVIIAIGIAYFALSKSQCESNGGIWMFIGGKPGCINPPQGMFQ